MTLTFPGEHAFPTPQADCGRALAVVVLNEKLGRAHLTATMHRFLPRDIGAYRVIFTPPAWKAVGLMPTAVFEAFQKAVDDLADKFGRLNVPASEGVGPLRLTVGELVILYERDDTARAITLTDIVCLPATRK
jgi:hypothetical protein